MKQKYFFFLASFFIPLTILSISLSIQNIWWGSDTTILASDGFHQYAIFATTLRNILHGQDSLFYSFTSGLGLNFYALMSYYLGSFLSPLVYFFDVKSMPDALYLFTLVKVGLIGLSTFTSLSTIYKKANHWLLISLSTSFALMSFIMSQIEINMWLDVFILVPLIILGLHRLIHQQSYWLYVTALTTLFIQNYYFGYMTAIFISLWFLVQLTDAVKHRLRSIIDFIICSGLSGLISAVMLLPTYLDLRTHGETLTKLSNILTEKSWYLDLFAKNFVGSYDTTKFGSIPMIYVGLLPLILALLFFTIKSIKWPVKLAYALLLMTIIASFYLEPLDLFWQGMHAPNMFLHRYSWVFSISIIYLAGKTLEHLEKVKWTHLITVFAFLLVGFSATVYFRSHYPFLHIEQFGITALFLLAYLIIFVSFHAKQIPYKLYIVLTLFFTVFEISVNSYYQLNALSQEWHFPSRDSYERQLSDIDNLVKSVKDKHVTFFRMERLLPQTGNDSMKFGYNGISQFSSVRNRQSSQLLDKFGFRSDGTNLNLRYQNNTLIADSLFNITFNLHHKPLNKYGFEFENQIGEMFLYENRNASQLAILTKEPFTDLDISVNTLDNQTKLLNQLSGLNHTYFYKLSSFTDNLTDVDKQLVTTVKKDDGSSSANFSIEVTSNSQVYLSLPHITSSNPDNKETKILINGQLMSFTRDNAFSLFDLGYYASAQNLDIELIFPETTDVSFHKPNIYALDTLAYQQAIDQVNSRAVNVTSAGNQVSITYDSPADASLLVTLPYDKGWTAKQDGQPLPVKSANGGLILLDAKKGHGEIVLTFVPNGLKAATILSSIGIISFVLFYSHRKRQLIKQSNVQNCHHQM
ncbi:YfhO family protein [Streptococcus entericus]|uniref:YfhO family protein n=1 Tax=Streptococcus entericus TaxID=155680 RepID=UPI000368433C|nr:YfhO family protein [Streptococcus entericus]